ncbi:MAG: pyruvate dehydrogenase (acetyl-transferring) E1 component subunit alpha [Natronomonas sp.]|uniref:pyruvate dehydrogenase (acetyl-transferring) E1 component subunit alpha n=1 Tax=Natronomonas sp. TaxID=2184060 RepID=UPI00286FF5D5|nr:pyruvate dehydrogenase (acetyl-transferring) E1 component subunit alpha [Natronomonas sp.]MDR9381924.1 pyruvate dehydrogenase (acetyl-transferring) E1 component subunit alpha [Natronomonas sp.]MDR9429365.1 pyruvate dehydrogenase (acetyl-transferring) E1 component subunit alpha [Natronomonas sp.]
MSVSRGPRDRVQILDEEGTVREGATVPDIDDDSIVEMYREMRLARHFDGRAVSLQRQGRMGTYPPLSGQEAAQVGSAMALDDSDWLFPSYREHAAAHVRGVGLDRTLRYWMGDERGNAHRGLNVFPVAVPIATQILHATGASWAADLRGDDAAFLCYFGDGATSEGDFHEGLNFAGVFDLPAIFFCNNNQWAISVPRERQSASETLAQKAHAYGFEGVQVDGMDPLAVYQVTRDAVTKANDPEAASDESPGRATRPTLIEAVQYRFGAHTTADDPSVYRDDDEVERWRQKDPIPRLETYLRDRGLLDDESVDAIGRSVEDEVAAAIEAAESTSRPEPSDMFDNVFAERTDPVAAQAAHLEQLRERYGDEELLE